MSTTSKEGSTVTTDIEMEDETKSEQKSQETMKKPKGFVFRKSHVHSGAPTGIVYDRCEIQCEVCLIHVPSTPRKKYFVVKYDRSQPHIHFVLISIIDLQTLVQCIYAGIQPLRQVKCPAQEGTLPFWTYVPALLTVCCYIEIIQTLLTV